MIKKDHKILVAGARGMVGSAICRRLKKMGFDNLLTPSSRELDLTRQEPTQAFFLDNKPDLVFLAAAKVGGIHANDAYPGEFIYQNLAMETNVIESARLSSVKKLLFLGSSCIYHRQAPQPMKEEYLLSGKLEPTNMPYALAKIAGLVMCQAYNRQYGVNFISCMPTNLYGPGDNYHPTDSHVIPGLIQRFHQAKISGAGEVIVWGTGSPLREFLHVDDLARAAVMLMQRYQGELAINVGAGQEVSIRELAELIKRVVGFEGDLGWDETKPDGTPRKLLDCTRLEQFGFSAAIGLPEGLEMTYRSYLAETLDSS